MIKSYYLARVLNKFHIPSFKHCQIDRSSKVASGSSLTKVKMGRYSYVGHYTHITDAEIGNFCSIGGFCGIGGGIHPMTTVSTSPVFLEGKNIMKKHFAKISYSPSQKVVIGHDVWIGEGSYIMPGVTIGAGAVIGAHSVVTKDVAPYSIVVGVPGTEIRKRFDENTIDRLVKLEWWNWSEDELTDKGTLFDDPGHLLNAEKKS